MAENKIKITWYGTASVRIAAGSSQLLIDPFYPFPDSQIRIAPHTFADCGHILISHGHFDHIGSISEIVRDANDKTIVHCTKTPYQTLLRKGVGETNLHQIGAGDVFRAGAFQITAYQGKHIHISAGYSMQVMCSRHAVQYRKGMLGKLMKLASCPEKNETMCYLVEGFGKRILILGSLALAPDIAYPTGADLACFPYQGSRDLCGIAWDIYRQLKPKAVLLTHYDDTFPPFSSEIDTSEFEQIMKTHAAVYKLPHGGMLEI